MRAVAVVWVACAACEFDPGRLAVMPDDARVDTTTLADAPDAFVACATPKVWHAAFDVDPTTIDGNGDSTNDWAMRDQGAMPGTLASGVWAAPGTPIRPMDGQPKQDFATRTIVDVRMRNTVRAPTFGAVMWINVDYTIDSFAPLYVVVQLQTSGNAQDVTLYGKTDVATSVPLFQTSVATKGFIDIQLDIEPDVDRLTLTVDGSTAVQTYSTIARNGNDDRWPTVLAWNGDAEVDDFRVSVCP